MSGPTFDEQTNTITIPRKQGVCYFIDGRVVSGEVQIEEETLVEAKPILPAVFRPDTVTEWVFAPNSDQLGTTWGEED